MNIKRPLAPAFLNKLDNYLLLNNPSVWAARAHLVVYYSLLFIIALSVVYYALPDDPRSFTSVYVWVGFLSIICILALVAWVIYLLRFNVFKRYGVVKPVTTLVDFVLYFMATAIIILFCFVPMAVETVKANQQYSSTELVNDINNINQKICQLEYDSLPKQWRSDTVCVVDTLYNRSTQSADYNTDDAVTTDSSYAPYKRTYREIDTAALAGIIKIGDSLNRMNDSTYVLYHCPDYSFLNVYNIAFHSAAGLLTSEQLYYKVNKPYRAADKEKVKAELRQMLDKYFYEGNDLNYNYEGSASNGYVERINKFYKLRNIERGIENVADRKYRWTNHGYIFFLFWFYFSFIITLLVFAFRHTTPRVFFLSLLTSVILFILTLLLMVFISGSGKGYYLWMIFYFVLFAVLSATAFTDRKRKVAKGIAINLFVFMLPFMPLVATGLYYEWLREKNEMTIAASLFVDYDAMLFHFQLAQIAGPVILLILLLVYVHRLYRRWWGLPEE